MSRPWIAKGPLTLCIAAALAVGPGCEIGAPGDVETDGDDFSDNGDGGDASSLRRFALRVENTTPYRYLRSGIFETPVGQGSRGPLNAAGKAYEFSFTAAQGHSLSFALMFGQSNDWFYAPTPGGIPLFSGEGEPISGNVTAEVRLWDAGTEADEEPGCGATQGGFDTGERDPDPRVRQVAAPGSFLGAHVPSVSDVLRVTVTSAPAGRAQARFTVRIENVQTAGPTLVASCGTHSVNLSPGVYVVHDAPNPLFTPGEMDHGEGLARIAESGDGSYLFESVSPLTGCRTGWSPFVWATSRAPGLLFRLNEPDYGDGLEDLAEWGDTTRLAEALVDSYSVGDTGVASVPVGATEPGGLPPGQSYEWNVRASPGDRLFLASMYGQSNDYFAAPDEDGIALFEEDGTPRSGDVTRLLHILDAGTELNEPICVGVNQPARTRGQPGHPNLGPSDARDYVRRAEGVAPTSMHLRVTLTPL